MVPKDKVFHSNDMKAIWQRFCGFLDLSLEEFMEIQEGLLLEEIELVADTPLGKKIINGNRPNSLAEFRDTVPLTTYDDYAPYIGNCEEDALFDRPFYWSHTSGSGGNKKWAPYFLRNDEVMSKAILGCILLSSANQKGEVNIKPGAPMLLLFPPRPYGAGWGAFTSTQRISAQVIPPLEQAEKMEFKERMQTGLKMSLKFGLDVVTCMSSVLVKVGEAMYNEEIQRMKFSAFMLHPAVLFRLIRAIILAKRQNRPILPKDFWRPKSIIAWGADTAVYKDQIAFYWGREPYEVHIATEPGMIAMQSWNKKDLTLIPDSSFYEFIPEEEWLKNQDDPEYQPATVLLNEVEAGKRYELVISNFYGMPFLRYRQGDMFRITALRDDEAGIDLPQLVFDSRADDMIIIAGFPWINEKAVWQVLANTGIKYEDWILRKEWDKDKPVLHLYIELKEDRTAQDVEQLVHHHFKSMDSDFIDLENMLGIRPFRASLLSKGAFQRYYEEKHKAGYDLARLKPKHMNCSDTTIQDIIRLSALKSDPGEQ